MKNLNIAELEFVAGGGDAPPQDDSNGEGYYQGQRDAAESLEQFLLRMRREGVQISG